MENKFDEAYGLASESRSLKERIRQVENKISNCKVIRGVSRAAACVSAAVAGVAGFSAIQSMNFLDNFPLSQEQYLALDNAFSGQVATTTIAMVAVAGCAAVSFAVSSVIKHDEKLLGMLQHRQNNAQDKIDELNEGFSKEPEHPIYDYQKDSEYAEDKGDISGDAERIKGIFSSSLGKDEKGEQEFDSTENLEE